MWPFKKKAVDATTEPAPEESKDSVIKISSKDSPMERAEKIMRGAGFVINTNMYNQLPWIAMALEKYQRLDYADGIRHGRRSARRNSREDGNDN